MSVLCCAEVRRRADYQSLSRESVKGSVPIHQMAVQSKNRCQFVVQSASITVNRICVHVANVGQDRTEVGDVGANDKKKHHRQLDIGAGR